VINEYHMANNSEKGLGSSNCRTIRARMLSKNRTK